MDQSKNYEKVLSVLNSLGYAKKYWFSFQENEMEDSMIALCLSSQDLISQLDRLIPVMAHRIKFIVEFKKLFNVNLGGEPEMATFLPTNKKLSGPAAPIRKGQADDDKEEEVRDEKEEQKEEPHKKNVEIEENEPKILNQDLPVPFYRFFNQEKTDHFYTTNKEDLKKFETGSCGVYEPEGVAGRIFTKAQQGTVPLHRYSCECHGNHFFTTTFCENSRFGQVHLCTTYEGVVGHVMEVGQVGTLPFFRFFSETNRDYFYTTTRAEVKVMERAGYKFHQVEAYIFPH